MATQTAPRNGNGRQQANQATTQPEAEPKPTASKALADRNFTFKPFLSNDEITLTVRTVIQFLCKPTKKGEICSDEQALRFIMLCKARGLNPWEGDAYIVGYDTSNGPEFNLITAHQAFLKRAEVHPEYDGMESGVVVLRNKDVVEYQGDMLVPGDQLIGGWARVYRTKKGRPMYKRLSIGAYQKTFGVWSSNSAGMIVKCAEADALRSSFPNSLGGMYLDGEHATESPAKVEVVSSRPNTLESLGQRIGTAETIPTTTTMPEKVPVQANGTVDAPNQMSASENSATGGDEDEGGGMESWSESPPGSAAK